MESSNGAWLPCEGYRTASRVLAGTSIKVFDHRFTCHGFSQNARRAHVRRVLGEIVEEPPMVADMIAQALGNILRIRALEPTETTGEHGISKVTVVEIHKRFGHSHF